jgi:hypothetical protein
MENAMNVTVRLRSFFLFIAMLCGMLALIGNVLHTSALQKRKQQQALERLAIRGIRQCRIRTPNTRISIGEQLGFDIPCVELYGVAHHFSNQLDNPRILEDLRDAKCATIILRYWFLDDQKMIKSIKSQLNKEFAEMQIEFTQFSYKLVNIGFR